MMAYNEYRYTPGIRQRGDMTWAPVIIAPAEPPPMTEKARPRPIHVTPRTPARLLHLTPCPLSGKRRGGTFCHCEEAPEGPTKQSRCCPPAPRPRCHQAGAATSMV